MVLPLPHKMTRGFGVSSGLGACGIPFSKGSLMVFP